MDNPCPRAKPWWRYGFVWLVIAGPAAVVVAGVATLLIAAQGADSLVAKDYYRLGIEINHIKLVTGPVGVHAKTYLSFGHRWLDVSGSGLRPPYPAAAVPSGAL